jgi:hypothetical protein
VVERPLVESQQVTQERHELLHARRRVIAVEAVPVALHALGAGPEPEDEAAVGERVEISRLGRQDQRRAPEGVGDRRPERDALGGQCHGGEAHRRGVVGELGRPDRLEAGFLGDARRRHRLVDRRQRENDAELGQRKASSGIRTARISTRPPLKGTPSASSSRRWRAPLASEPSARTTRHHGSRGSSQAESTAPAKRGAPGDTSP